VVKIRCRIVIRCVDRLKAGRIVKGAQVDVVNIGDVAIICRATVAEPEIGDRIGP
jgi:hypothetical protein